MEVKLSQKNHLSLPPSNPITTNFLSFPHCCFLKSWINSKSALKKHFKGLAESCRFHILEISKPRGQSSNKHHLLPVVKEDETLNSISRLYGVSIPSLAAANENVLDADLLLKGQLHSIPAFATRNNQLYQMKKSRLPSFYDQERLRGSQNILGGVLNKKPFIMLSALGSPHAKSTGYFLVLVPLIAFCIRCIVGAFHTGFFRDMRQETSDKSRSHDGNRGMRWKYALSDIEDPNLDSESRIESNSISEDQEQILFEDMSHAYSKLEHDYEKFLSECGMSKWGYWRGGFHR
ncbi:hypothetical protein P3X46_021984 [Hevea brasiliensis]|uniref:LysM domain-containing protein n=1 Tax=Hevea brasiliensis TaxID=3981 RepID=A0ABQ9LHA5_HEVBR|nr:uncharacterized protein LOC110645418 isoform X2 [Hevea brasiliensis]KAJ9167321.1 hypothetical protein P3X46_021984 [Hevea brasiliensis]